MNFWFSLEPVSCPNMMALGQWGWCPGKSWAEMIHCSLLSNLGMEEIWASSHSLSKENRRQLRGKSHMPADSHEAPREVRMVSGKQQRWWKPGYGDVQPSPGAGFCTSCTKKTDKGYHMGAYDNNAGIKWSLIRQRDWTNQTLLPGHMCSVTKSPVQLEENHSSFKSSLQ